MLLLLPDRDYVFENGAAEIKDGILYIYRAGIFKELMYQLTYLIFGADECYYCHHKIKNSENAKVNPEGFTQITLDHLIPQEFGGPTIPNNLRPSCSGCNGFKGNLYPDEFEQLKQIPQGLGKISGKQIREFKRKISDIQEMRRFGQIPSIPKEWFTSEVFRNIYVNFWIAEPLGYAYKKQETFFRKYKRLPKPIIISSNKFLLDGFTTILLAKYNYKERIDTIVLENVVFQGFPIGI